MLLDEAPEFPRAVLDALRQPLESGRITVHRAAGAAEFPARCQVLLAANPCPCGNAGDRQQPCECTPAAVRRYLGRISGPLLDRMDLRVRVPRVTTGHIRAGDGSTPTTAEARLVVERARARMTDRLQGTGWTRNAEVAGSWLRTPGHSDPGATKQLDQALDRGTLTMREWDRAMRVAWTLADLQDADRPGERHVLEALALRSAL